MPLDLIMSTSWTQSRCSHLEHGYVSELLHHPQLAEDSLVCADVSLVLPVTSHKS